MSEPLPLVAGGSGPPLKEKERQPGFPLIVVNLHLNAGNPAPPANPPLNAVESHGPYLALIDAANL